LAQGLAQGVADISVRLLIFTHRLFQHLPRFALSYFVPISWSHAACRLDLPTTRRLAHASLSLPPCRIPWPESGEV